MERTVGCVEREGGDDSTRPVFVGVVVAKCFILPRQPALKPWVVLRLGGSTLYLIFILYFTLLPLSALSVNEFYLSRETQVLWIPNGYIGTEGLRAI